MINKEMADKAILNELGARVCKYRINKNMTQAGLAAEAGVSNATIHRVENGASIKLLQLIRILRALGIIENLDLLLPKPTESPLQQLKMRGKIRQRVKSSKTADKDTDWSWGDKE